ncbi:MAG TPA: M56 family metallopeptidase [Bryobacteraceae bacterium]|nr:M56 family metallopeptidase [Bryobacteraceae bacterium]
MLESYLISVAMKSTVLLAAGLVCLRFLRGRDAAARHLVCLLALAGASAVTLLALWSPQWSFLISVPAGPRGAVAGSNVAAELWAWPPALAFLWALGTFAMMLRAAGGWMVLFRARRRSVHFQEGDAAEVRIVDVSSPLTCGVLRPLILLPRAARDWDEARLRAVLLHESAHVRRRDCMAKFAAQGARALLWWNPLAWMVAARLNHEQELACDEAVLAAGIPADAYATVLLDVARECSSSLILGCAMGGNGAAALRERFTHLFEWRQEIARSTRRAAIAIPLLFLLMTTVSFAEKIYKIGPGIVPPKVLDKTSEPQYTPEAKAAELEGTVGLTIVVGTDHQAHNIKVVKSLDKGLDANAVTSIKTWRFQPGTKNGKPVPVMAKIEVNFRLQ